MNVILRSIHALLYETPGGLRGWLGRTNYWKNDRQQHGEWERDQWRKHEGSIP